MSGRRATLAALLLGFACGPLRADGVGAQIIAALERYRVAVLQMDYDDEIAEFAEDAELSHGSDIEAHGRPQIRALIMSQAASKIVDYELHPAATRVEGSVALQSGIFSQRIISPRHEASVVTGVFDLRWSRQADGTWLISRLHDEPVEKQPSAR